MAMAMPNVTGGAATSGANGNNELSQTVTIGDFVVSPPSWVRATGLGQNNLLIFAALGIVGAVVFWKLRK